MRTIRHLTAIAALALTLTACGTDDEPPPASGDTRAALEEELADARTTIRDLEVERDALARELEVAREQPPEDDLRTGDGVPLPWSADGLVDQPRQREEVGPDGQRFASTPWVESELPDGVEEPAATIGELAAVLAAALEGPSVGLDTWEVTVRALLDPDDATKGTIAVLSWGYQDDAVAGRDVRVSATSTGDGWTLVDDAEERVYCRRGGASAGLCV